MLSLVFISMGMILQLGWDGFIWIIFPQQLILK